MNRRGRRKGKLKSCSYYREEKVQATLPAVTAMPVGVDGSTGSYVRGRGCRG